jgi:hypothetical protein
MICSNKFILARPSAPLRWSETVFFTDMSEIITWSNLICWQRSHECATKKTCFSIHGACSPRRNKNMAIGELPVEVGQIPRQASLLKLFSM